MATMITIATVDIDMTMTTAARTHRDETAVDAIVVARHRHDDATTSDAIRHVTTSRARHAAATTRAIVVARDTVAIHAVSAIDDTVIGIQIHALVVLAQIG